MTNNKKSLSGLIDEQERLLEELRAEAQALDEAPLALQNESLSQQLGEERNKNEALEAENEELKKQLSATKNALFAKMADEKLGHFLNTQSKLDKLYYNADASVISRLQTYEMNCRRSINNTTAVIEKFGSEQYGDIMQRLNEIDAELYKRHNEINEYKKKSLDGTIAENAKMGLELKNEALTENEKRTAMKQKSLETFVGLNVLSKAGIMLFIVGIIMLGRFAYLHLNDYFKGGLIYLLGAVLIIIGELFNKKEKTVFSTALISGGVAVLFAAVATGHFAFGLYGIRITFMLCILVTAIALALAQQLQSQMVGVFAAVGGYLPVVAAYMVGFGSAAADKTFLPVSCGYFCLLAIVIFIMTYNKKWTAAQFIGYGLHTLAIIGVSSCADALSKISGFGSAPLLAAGFAVASFLIYLMTPAVKIFKAQPLSIGDNVLLGINTVIGSIAVVYNANRVIDFYNASEKITGIVFLIFTVIYAALMAFSVQDKTNDKAVSSVISAVSALIFSMLVVPVSFGIDYAPIAWAVEGTVLAVISLERRLKIPEYAGLSCITLSYIAYRFTAEYNLYNFRQSVYLDEYADILRYDPAHPLTNSFSMLTVLTLGVILAAFWIYTIRGILECEKREKILSVYIITELISATGLVLYLRRLYSLIIQSRIITVYSSFTDVAFIIIFVIISALIIRTGIFKNKASLFFSDSAGLLLVPVTAIALDFFETYNYTRDYYGAVKSMPLVVLNLVLLLLINLGAELFFARAVSSVINRFKLPVWIYTASVSASVLLLVTTTATMQFDIAFSSVIISAIYLGVACVLLYIGFRKSFTVVRSGGLVLILFAFAKLCFIDTRQLDSGWKIASYFAFGAILITVSYFYQRFAKRLEKETESIIEKTIE